MILEYDESLMIVATIGYAISLLITIVLYKIFGHKDLKTRKIPLLILTLVILLFEIIKQIKNIIPGLNPYSLDFKDYGMSFDGYALPFHLCSFFIFFPILALVTKGKVRDLFENITLVWAVAISIFTIFYPQSVYGDQVRALYNDGQFSHSILFHQTAVLYLMLIISLRPYEIGIKKFWYIPIGFLIYGAIAIPMAFIFNANYCSILSCDFFPFLDTIRVNHGYFIYLPVLLIIGMIFGTILYLASVGVMYLRKKINSELGFIIGFSITCTIMVPLSFIYRELGWSNMKYIYLLLAETILPSLITIAVLKIFNKQKTNSIVPLRQK